MWCTWHISCTAGLAHDPRPRQVFDLLDIAPGACTKPLTCVAPQTVNPVQPCGLGFHPWSASVIDPGRSHREACRVMYGSSLVRAVRSLVVAASFLIVLLMSGCQDGYPTDLSYPLRSDLLV